MQYIELTDLSLSVYLTYQGVGRALAQPRNTHLHQFLCSNQPETSEKFSADCRKNLLRCLTSSNFRISMDPLKKNKKLWVFHGFSHLFRCFRPGQPTKIHIPRVNPLNPLNLPGRPSATPIPRRARAARRGAAGMWGTAVVVGPGNRS